MRFKATHPPFPFSTLLVAICGLAMPALLPGIHSPAHAVAPDTLRINYRDAEATDPADALQRSPDILTRPSLIDGTTAPEIHRALPYGLSLRNERPIPALDSDPLAGIDGRVDLNKISSHCTYRARDTEDFATPPGAESRGPFTLTPVPVIQYDPQTVRYMPSTPPLPDSVITNYPWTVVVSVQYDAMGLMKHVFLRDASENPELNRAAIRAALATHLGRQPGVPLTGEILFRCLVGLETYEVPQTTGATQTP